MYCLGRLLNKLACLDTNDFLAWQIDIDLIIKSCVTALWGKMVPLLLGVFSHTLHTLSLLSVGRSVWGAFSQNLNGLYFL